MWEFIVLFIVIVILQADAENDHVLGSSRVLARKSQTWTRSCRSVNDGLDVLG